MNARSADIFLISVTGKDRVGVVSAVTSYLFETGANLADCAYAVLGEGFEFTCVGEFGAGATLEEIETGVAAIELLEGARITVSRFPFQISRGQTSEITHIVEIKGGDRPGLVARLSEVLVDYDANIVRMSSRRTATEAQGYDYRTRFAVNILPERFTALEAALYNTAGSLRLECQVTEV